MTALRTALEDAIYADPDQVAAHAADAHLNGSVGPATWSDRAWTTSLSARPA